LQGSDDWLAPKPETYTAPVRPAERESPIDLTDLGHRYLELVKRSVMGLLHEQTYSLVPEFERSRLSRALAVALPKARREKIASVRPNGRPSDPHVRAEGRDWPLIGETMIGEERLDNVRACIESVIADRVPGDLIETGVWRGGTTIFMRAVLEAYDVHDRSVWVADSFQGLPPPGTGDDPKQRFDAEHGLAVSLESVRANFKRYGLLDDQVKFVPGWFSETLPTLRDQTWAVIRLDGDLYRSTYDALSALYPSLSPGGYLIVDDWCLEQCRRAVDTYRGEQGITEPIEQIDWTGVFWRKRFAD
jgi:O-methyltransferase